MSRVSADLWKYRAWNEPGGRAAYWVGKALKPNASALAQGAAIAFYSMALAKIGEVQARRALELAGVEFPDWLVDVPPAPELVKRQRAAKAERKAA